MRYGTLDPADIQNIYTGSTRQIMKKKISNQGSLRLKGEISGLKAQIFPIPGRSFTQKALNWLGYFVFLSLSSLVLLSCKGDDLESVVSPEQESVLTQLSISREDLSSSGTADDEIPVNLSVQFQVVGVYDNGVTEDLTANTIWSLNIDPTENTPPGSFMWDTASDHLEITAQVVDPNSENRMISTTRVFRLVEAQVTGIQISPVSGLRNEGEYLVALKATPIEFRAMAEYNNGTEADLSDLVEWSTEEVMGEPLQSDCQNPIAAGGCTTLSQEGWFQVQAAFGGVVSDPAMIEVTPADPVDIVIGPKNSSLKEANSLTFSVEQILSNYQLQPALNTSVNWSSNAPACAGVNSNGIVTAANVDSDCTAVITANGVYGSDSAEVNILAVKPEAAPGGFSFVDEDSTPEYLSGDLIIYPAADENNIDEYVIYWGKNGVKKQEIQRFSAGSASYQILFENDAILEDADEFLAFSSNELGEMEEGIRLEIGDRGYPGETAAWVNFSGDTDNDENQIAGIVSIGVYAEEGDIDYYKIYWGDSANSLLPEYGPFAVLPKTGSNLNFEIPENTLLPQGAAWIHVLTANENGEMPVSQAKSDDFSDDF